MCNSWRDSFLNFYEDMGKMPDTCNGIARMNEDNDYSKFNCRWAYNSRGRRKTLMQGQLKRKKEKIKTPKTICLTLEATHFEYIQRQAIHKSIEKGVFIDTNQLIREILQEKFPQSLQKEMW
jgi:hypothetical protein